MHIHSPSFQIMTVYTSENINEVLRDLTVQSHFAISPDLYYSVSKRLRDLLNLWIVETRTCTSCGENYKEIDNLGSWRCAQHPLEAIYDQRKGYAVYQCCGKKKIGRSLGTNGCVRSDHTVLNIPYYDMHDIKLPKNLANIMPPYRESTPVTGSGREYTVEKALHKLRSSVRDQLGMSAARIDPESVFKYGHPVEYTIRRYQWDKVDQYIDDHFYNPKSKVVYRH